MFIWESLLDDKKPAPGPVPSDDIFSHCEKLSISGQEQNELVEEGSKI